MTHEGLPAPRILIVDDVPRNVQLLASLLAREGYQLVAAVDGAQALESIREELPDLVLLDVMMPGMDGFEVCRHLKQDPATAEIPVIVLTARTEPEDLVHGFEVGAVDYVSKPFTATELLARVRTHLALKGALDRERALRMQLESALANVKLLSGLIPICASCKKIRDDQGFWLQVEAYVAAHSEATFSHGICPDCARELYPELFQAEAGKKEGPGKIQPGGPHAPEPGVESRIESQG